MEQKKVFDSHSSDSGWMSRIYNNLNKLNNNLIYLKDGKVIWRDTLKTYFCQKYEKMFIIIKQKMRYYLLPVRMATIKIQKQNVTNGENTGMIS